MRLTSFRLAAVALILFAVKGTASAQAPAMPLPTKVPIPGSDLYRLRFPSGAVTANDQCPVAKRPLNPKMPAVWVNGQPIGFC